MFQIHVVFSLFFDGPTGPIQRLESSCPLSYFRGVPQIARAMGTAASPDVGGASPWNRWRYKNSQIQFNALSQGSW